MTLNYKINKPAEYVYQYLSDMQKFASVHPVISKIEKISDNKYLAYETLRIGIIPYSFNYYILTNRNINNLSITMQARVMLVSRIVLNFNVKESNGAAHVSEKIEFSSLIPINPLLKRIFKKHHSLLFQNIENSN